MARFAASGHLVFTAPDGTLMAARFDPDRLESLGPSVAMVSGVRVKGNSASMFSVSRNGSLLYKAGASSTGLFRVVWVSPDGSVERLDPDLLFDASSPSNAGVAEIAVRLSPDERQIALKITSEGGEDIWVRDLDGGSTSRLTFYDGIDRRPEWSADGSRIMFNTDRGEDRDLWERAADGTGSPTQILDLDRPILEAVRSPDEEWFILRLGGTAATVGGRDIVGLRRGDTTLTPLAAESYDEKAIALSPDGRWLAYESTETGQDEIYVRPFPNVNDGKWQISSSGAIARRWARSGDGIYYVSGQRDLTFAKIDFAGGGVRVDARTPLYNVDQLSLRIVANYATWDVASDGRQLMTQFDVGDGVVNRLVLVDNWFEELKARVPRN
jgi:serine/threonine-protein kinase